MNAIIPVTSANLTIPQDWRNNRRQIENWKNPDCWLFWDIETRSIIDLPAQGQYVYAAHPSTEITVVAWAVGVNRLQLWYPLQEPIPAALVKAILDPNIIKVAHNASFERTVLTLNFLRRAQRAHAAGQRALKRFWTALAEALRPVRNWSCTASRAAALGLPRTLAGAGAMRGLPVQKDKDGYNLMLQMCRPIGWQGDTPLWRQGRADMERLGAYCAIDTEVERLLHFDLPPLSPTEYELWAVTEEVNDRGIRVDQSLVESLQEMVKNAEFEINNRLDTLTGERITRVTQHKRFLQWMQEQGFPDLDSVDKSVVAELLEQEHLPDHVKEALILRQEGSKSSTSKFRSILGRMNTDGRLRGALVYCGAASTGRWSSRGAQLQNLPRGGKVKRVEDAINAVLEARSLQFLRDEFGVPPMVLASELLRPCFIAAPAGWLVRGDYSQIEARVLAWLAGQDDVLEAFRKLDRKEGPDIYCATASQMFGRPITKADPERQAGKVAVLACGFQGGMKAFMMFAKIYGLKISEADAEYYKTLWRNGNPKIVQFWWALDNAALAAMKDPDQGKHYPSYWDKYQNETVVMRRDVWFKRIGNVLTMRMPSGRSLYYWNAGVEKRTIKYKDKQTGEEKTFEREVVFYHAEDSQTRTFGKCYGYGGLWSENLTQSTARDVMAESFINLNSVGFRPVLTVHDEAVCELEQAAYPTEEEAKEAVRQVMVLPPAWAEGLPIAVDCSADLRYLKDD